VVNSYSLNDQIKLIWLLITQPSFQWVAWTLTPGVKRAELEAENSPPYSAEVKNA